MKIDEQDSIFLNSTLTSSKTKKEIHTKSYIDSSRENSRSRRDFSSAFDVQDDEFDYK